MDEQVVAVEVSGLTPNTEFEVWQCSNAAVPAEGRCARAGVADPGLDGVRSDAGGSISENGVVQAVIEEVDGQSYDCRAPSASCAIVVLSGEGDFASRPVLAAATLAFAADGPIAPVTLTVTPSTNLRDGQFVHFEGTGFDPDGRWNFSQCRGVAAPRGPCRVGFIEAVPVDAAGEARANVRLGAEFDFADEAIDCRLTPCSIVMSDGAHVAVAAVTFAPTPTTPVPVAPAFTG
ncbi:MAG: hypothetical protein JNK12_19610 [Acidimicrobiales bacterium]|nr:hypothetical protein [Acidimicrobiales bacterium]